MVRWQIFFWHSVRQAIKTSINGFDGITMNEEKERKANEGREAKGPNGTKQREARTGWMALLQAKTTLCTIQTPQMRILDRSHGVIRVSLFSCSYPSSRSCPG